MKFEMSGNPKPAMRRLLSIAGLVLGMGLVSGPLAAAVPGSDQIAPGQAPAAIQDFTTSVPDFGFAPALPDGSFRVAFGDGITNGVVKIIQNGARTCSALPSEYRPDCLASVFRSARSPMNRAPDYNAASSELNRLSKSLDRLVKANIDRDAPAIKKSGNSYRAVKKTALRDVNRQAAAAITETQTKLLRSIGNSQNRKVHYTRIASAVNSTKKILRS